MEQKQLTANFDLNEFGGVYPDKRLLYILQSIRNITKLQVVITDAKRTVEDHIKIYKQLELTGKVKTKKNGLSDNDLIDVIPWGSRHLPSFNTKKLRAVDIKAVKCDLTGEFYTGEELKDLVDIIRNSENFRLCMKCLGYKDSDLFLGLGIGQLYLHIDIDRRHDAEWHYEY